jgi:hypothetical protein
MGRTLVTPMHNPLCPIIGCPPDGADLEEVVSNGEDRQTRHTRPALIFLERPLVVTSQSALVRRVVHAVNTHHHRVE